METFIHKRYYLVDIYILQHLKNEGIQLGVNSAATSSHSACRAQRRTLGGSAGQLPRKCLGSPLPHHLPPRVSSGKGTAHFVTVLQPQLYICTGLDYRSINYISKLHLTFNY